MTEIKALGKPMPDFDTVIASCTKPEDMNDDEFKNIVIDIVIQKQYRHFKLSLIEAADELFDCASCFECDCDSNGDEHEIGCKAVRAYDLIKKLRISAGVKE